jgi:hypothetical protein
MLWLDPRNNYRYASVPQNAATEWQARRVKRGSGLLVACPFEGLVGRPSSLKKAAPPPAFRKDDTPLNRKPGGLMEQSNASLQRGDQG